MNAYKEYLYGIKSLQFEEQIEYRNESYTREILFTPKKTSSKYLFRIVYPTISEDEDSYLFRKKTKLTTRIRDATKDLEFTIVDIKSNKVIAKKEADGGFLVDGGIIQLRLVAKIRLSRHREYKILIKIPPKKDIEERFLNPVIFGGIHLDPFL